MAAETDPPRAASTQARGHKVEAGGGERLLYLGIEFAILSSAESTGGAFSIVEELHPLDTPAADPPESRLPVSDTGRRRWRGYRGNAGDSSPRDWLALDHRECRGRLVALGR